VWYHRFADWPNQQASEKYTGVSMRRTLLILPLFVFLFGCAIPTQATPTPTDSLNGEIVVAATETEPPVVPSLIFYNGDVLSMEASMPTYQAIAIRGDEIVAVGTDAEILDLKGPATDLIDLGGHTLMPGFIEGHSHVLHFAPGGEGGKEEAMNAALSYGLTTLNEMVVDQNDITWFLNAEERGDLKLRVNAFALYNDLGLDSNGNTMIERVWFPENDPILDSDRWFRIPGIKVYVDGSFVPGRGCPALTDPYPEDFQATPDFQSICFAKDGDLYLSQEEMNRVVAEAQARGFRVAFHIMGDRGVDVALNAIELALDGESNSLYRHAIQHSSSLRPDQVDRYAALDIISSVRGYFNTCDQDEYPYYFGPDRYTWAGNRYILVERGIHAFSEGDFLWRYAPDDLTASTQLNPLVNLFGLVTRKQLCADGSFKEPAEWLHPDAISVEQALRMLTFEPAYAVSQENVIGTLEAGKFADLIILSGNPLTIDPDEILNLEVWMTMVGGTTEYCAAGHDDLCP
jgi:predicted amidohydrolase YtcJ